jgi:hypothetical protein
MKLSDPTFSFPSAKNQSRATVLDVDARRTLVKSFADKLAHEYAVAETALAMAQTLRARLAAEAYERLTSGFDLARVLQEDVRAVSNDLHLRIYFDPTPASPSTLSPPAAPAPDQLRKQNGLMRRVEILDGNVGYLRIDGFHPPAMAQEPMTAAFAFLKNTDALIIDARFNHGGDPASVALLMSFLSEGEPYLVNTFHHRIGGRIEEFHTTDLGAAAYGGRKPVYALTSRRTFSGGEEFAYDIKAFKRGVVVGETTAGAANPTRRVDLGHGFFASIPFGRAINPVTKANWEGVGVAPDLPAPAEKALLRAHRAALEGLRSIARNPAELAILEGLVLKSELSETSSVDQRLLPWAALAGDYAPSFEAPNVTIEEKAGQLILRRPGDPDACLVHVAGDRYRLENLDDDYAVTFLVMDGDVRLLYDRPGAALILSKFKSNAY